MEDRSSPEKRNPLHVGLGNINDVPEVCPTSTLEACGHLVTQEDLVTAVASGSQVVGTTVLRPEPPLLVSDFPWPFEPSKARISWLERGTVRTPAAVWRLKLYILQ